MGFITSVLGSQRSNYVLSTSMFWVPVLLPSWECERKGWIPERWLLVQRSHAWGLCFLYPTLLKLRCHSAPLSLEGGRKPMQIR